MKKLLIMGRLRHESVRSIVLPKNHINGKLMFFIADLHIHSKYSRATAKNLDFENIYQSARTKGISLVGTGDFTFPRWVEEIEEKLEPAEPGLFALKNEIANKIDAIVPKSCTGKVRFILQTELSNIYKKDDKIRKNHNLVYFPDLDAVKRFNRKLDRIGNIKSDGRPILGLDAAELLEIVLETSEYAFFVPAHIWTPWFSLFGSRSGFDSMEECFGSLKRHIFAVETGLSSDPPMNWRIADLDHVRLISNSDAHSPGYLGRNATVFDTELDYFAVRNALETHDLERFKGTYDMYPHQGKYHYDGHRKCGIYLKPSKTVELNNICPKCGKPLTLGVLHRVQELADRSEGYLPENRHGFKHIIPLQDILSEIFDVGPNTKKVAFYYKKIIEILGPELHILSAMKLSDIDRAGIPLFAEAIARMRSGNIRIDPGHDGEYGKINIFSNKEKEYLKGEQDLFGSYRSHSLIKATTTTPERAGRLKQKNKKHPKQSNKNTPKESLTDSKKKKKELKPEESEKLGLIDNLNSEQFRAVTSSARIQLIQAGPGTGKTLTLTAKIAWLISEKGVNPENILALTFTNKAAMELEQRISGHMAYKEKPSVMSATFHSFCLNFLKNKTSLNSTLMDDELKISIMKKALVAGCENKKVLLRDVKLLSRFIRFCKQQLLWPDYNFDCISEMKTIQNLFVHHENLEKLISAYKVYESMREQLNLLDFEGLIFQCVRCIANSDELRSWIQNQYTYVFIDEYQDLNYGQYELVRLICNNKRTVLMVIGDPDQSIYGFRGSDNTYFKKFESDYPGCEKIVLRENYRSSQVILDASWQMISAAGEGHEKILSNQDSGQRLIIRKNLSDSAEAVYVSKMIESMVGGLSFFAFDARALEFNSHKEYSFADFVVLYRTRMQCKMFMETFEKEGIPFQTADKEEYLTLSGIREIINAFKILTNRNPEANFEFTDAVEMIKKQKLAEGPFETSVWLTIFKNNLGLDPVITAKPAFQKAYENLTALGVIYSDPEQFMDALYLSWDQDHLVANVEKVSLMSMHAAKGLEFPIVFVTGCENGLIPFTRGDKSSEDIDEERRLFYVAMTRAKEILCLTYAAKRRIYGQMRKQEKSQFLNDIEAKLAKYEIQTKKDRVANDRGPVQLELF